MKKKNHSKNDFLTPFGLIFASVQKFSSSRRSCKASAAPVCPGKGTRQSFLPLCNQPAQHLKANFQSAGQNFMNQSKGMFVNNPVIINRF